MKTRKLLSWLCVAAILPGFWSCKKEDTPSTNQNMTMNVTGLSNLGTGYAYEGWIMVDGAPVSTGTFTVNDSGMASRTSFPVNRTQLAKATAFVLTIEPSPDANAAPSDVKILAGDFSGNSASVSVKHPAALNTDFAAAAGTYILATPTDGPNTNETSGVWFLDMSAGPGPSLTLPTLPAGWRYEGWAVINGTPVTTGKFTVASGMDDSAPFSGTVAAGPPFPGEDFLMNAPAGLTFPTNLSGQKIVLTVEPHPDNSTKPFSLKPLAGDVPAGAMTATAYTLMNTAATSNPMGSVSRQ